MVGDFFFGKIPEIIFGPGKFWQLPNLIRRYGKNILIISGARSFTESPHYQEFEIKLREQSIHHYLVRITGEPSPQLIDAITSEYLLKDIDLVVAIGGGSVMDTGKAVAAMMGLDGFVQEYLEGVGTGKLHNGRKTPFIAVPTTAGTGSEMTRNAVLSSVGKVGFKKSLRHPTFIPDLALIDPELSISCPAQITAACGMDAFTQLLESFVSLSSSELTDALCISGLINIERGLVQAVHQPDNLQARSCMSYAAMISGICLANAGLGTIHGLASVLGGHFDIPHGVICGTVMGSVTRANIAELLPGQPSQPALEKYAEAGRIISRKTNLDQAGYCDALTDKIDFWIEELKIPRLGQYGLQAGDLEQIAGETEQKQNPVVLSQQLLVKILKERI